MMSSAVWFQLSALQLQKQTHIQEEEKVRWSSRWDTLADEQHTEQPNTDRGRQTCTKKEGKDREEHRTLKGHQRAWKSNTRNHKTQNHEP